MPVIKIFCAEPPDTHRVEGLIHSLHQLCVGTMGAHPGAIQCLLLTGVHILEGAPVFVEAHYRDRPDRQGQALVDFLEGLDACVQMAFDLKPRIRTFAVDQRTLGAVR
jgi:hypothetical protein